MLAIIVPARRASTRLNDKPMYSIAGKPLLLHVAERLRAIAPEIPTYYAVDDAEVKRLLEQNGFNAIMTSVDCPNGTVRIAEANRSIGATHIINAQGDEPQVQRVHLDLLADALRRGAPMATLALSTWSEEEFRNPARPKVIVGSNGQALYFSRSVIPYDRSAKEGENGLLTPENMNLARQRIGLHQGFYAYTASFLNTYISLPATPFEQIEKLEQLRVIEHGYPIQVRFNNFPTRGIDTIEDVRAFEKTLNVSATR